MKTIWKFPLQVQDVQVVQMPLPAQVLCVQPQGDGVCLWAEVDPNGERVNIEIAIIGTGHPIPDEAHKRYVNTFQMHGGTLVFHAFEVLA